MSFGDNLIKHLIDLNESINLIICVLKTVITSICRNARQAKISKMSTVCLKCLLCKQCFIMRVSHNHSCVQCYICMPYTTACLVVLKICKNWKSKCKLFKAHNCSYKWHCARFRCCFFFFFFTTTTLSVTHQWCLESDEWRKQMDCYFSRRYCWLHSQVWW